MRAKLVLNIQRITKQKLHSQKRHDLRLGKPLKNVDPTRTHLNQILAGTGSAPDDVAAVLESHKAKVKADNQTPFTRFVISASPEHFQTKTGEQDPKAVADFTKQAMTWLRKEYGAGVACAVLHLDEKTPHIHVVVVPLYEKKTKRGSSWAVSHHQHDATKGPNSYEALRHRAASSLDLDYGEPGNKPRTKSVREAEEAAAMTLDLAHLQRSKIIGRAKQEAGAITSKATKQAKEVLDENRLLWDHAAEGIKAKRAALAREKEELEARDKQLAREASMVAAARQALRLPPVPELEPVADRARRRPSDPPASL